MVLLSEAAETGARNERRLAAAVCAKENTFETIHGFLNRVMDVLGVPAHVPGLGEPCYFCLDLLLRDLQALNALAE